jgi:hypothetical protein
MKLFANDAPLRAAEYKASSMLKTLVRSGSPVVALGCLAATVLATLSGTGALQAAEDGVAVAIVYDTSGSMKESVKDAHGTLTPKYLIANRALLAISKQIQSFTTNNMSGPARRVEAGLWVFQGNDGREAIKFGPFDPAAIQQFANSFTNPSGSTPLGNTLAMASKSVLNSPLSRKHVLIITDGQNTAGPDPATVLPRLKHRAETNGTTLSVHFVAFNVDAKVFAAVKQQGATVVGASDEKQLNSQLEFIMQRKILLEDEEPQKK